MNINAANKRVRQRITSKTDTKFAKNFQDNSENTSLYFASDLK